jgi:hypothetical protein
LGGLLSISDELWKFNQTGEFLVSNQHYFDYAKNQFPGSLDKVEFFSFRIFELYQEPFISESTSASFFTELFARTFYDYEWRFISPNIPWANKLGFIGYSLGLVWVFFFIMIIFILIRNLKKIHTKLVVSPLYKNNSYFIRVLIYACPIYSNFTISIFFKYEVNVYAFRFNTITYNSW